MNSELKSKLKQALIEIEKMEQKISAQQKYNEEVAKLKLIMEIIREQVSYEDLNNSTR